MKSFYKKDVFSFLAFPALGGSQRLFWQCPSRQNAFKRYFLKFSSLLGLPFSYCFLWLELADATALLVFVSCCCCRCCLCRWPWWLMGLAWWSRCCPGWPERRGVISQVVRQLPVHLATDGLALPTPPASLYFLANQFMRFWYNLFYHMIALGKNESTNLTLYLIQ